MNRAPGWRARLAKAWPFEVVSVGDWAAQPPTWQDADPAVIEAAYTRMQRRPGGDWFVFAASSQLTAKPAKAFGATVAGRDLVAWRKPDGALLVAPRACPHLGADLALALVDGGQLVCSWHGLRLGERRHGTWKPLPAHDDGVLCWVRLDRTAEATPAGGSEPAEVLATVAALRPGAPAISAVARLEGVCEPEDVVSNRLDPWHGGWFHPYSFARLEVLSAPPVDAELPDEQDKFVVEVTFRMGRLGVPVIAEFTAPRPRTVVMRIVDGEGRGSVVESHATPLGPGADGRPRTAVIEAVIAHSGRRHFGKGLVAAPLIRPLMKQAAARLWHDDMAYAERLYENRS